MEITDKTKARVYGKLRTWLDLANARHMAEGRDWYANARTFAVTVAETYPVSIYKVIGVISALSPSVSWDRNKRQAEALVRAYSEGSDLSGVVVTTYGKQAEKARQILALPDRDLGMANVREILGRRAFKTLAFFDNILAPRASRMVTIDQHIIDAADFAEEWVSGAKWCYDLLAQAVTRIADDTGRPPCEVQAVIWVTYKDITAPAVKKPEPAPF